MDALNVMTSSDNNLMPYIAVQLQSMADNIKSRKVCFYLFHDKDVNEDYLRKLELLCKDYKNIEFNDVCIDDKESFSVLAQHGGGWNGVAYYPLVAHQYLPSDMERILYIDAGDIIFAGDPSPYYDADFNGKALTVTCARLIPLDDDRVRLYEEEDFYNLHYLQDIVRGLFNSGSYVINLNEMRNIGFGVNDYLALSDALGKVLHQETNIYWGDQGLLSAALVGNLNFFDFPKVVSLWYMPYNFCMWYFNAWDEPPEDYKPSVIHYAGAKKPWLFKYENYIDILQQNEDDLINLAELKKGQESYYRMWYEYAVKVEKKIKMI